jgi:predicted Zn finger-like uncharacterized protein
MMALVSNCPKCTTKLAVDDSLAGKKVRCPKCMEIFTMPGGTSTTPPLPIAQVVSTPGVQRPLPAAPIKAKPRATPPPLPPFESTEIKAGLPPFKEESFSDIKGTRQEKAKDAPKKPPVVTQIVSLIAAIIGAVLGRLAVVPVLIVVGFATAVGVPLYFLTSGARRRMVFAGALQGGHALMMLLIAILVTRGVLQGPPPRPLDFVEAILYFAGAILVVFLPYLPVIIIMTIYQSATFIILVLALTQGGLLRDVRIGLFLNMFLRLLGIAMMFLAYFEKPKPQALEPEIVEEPPPDEETQQPSRYRQRRPKEVPLGLILGLSLGGIVLVAGIVVAFFVFRNQEPNKQVKGPGFENPLNKNPDNLPLRNWQAFASADGSFAVSMPGMPKHTSRRASNRTIHVYELNDSGDHFSIATFDPPLPGRPPQLFQSLKTVRSDFPLGRIDPENPVALGSYQGHELTIHFADRTIVQRMLHGHGRSFTVRVSSARLPAIAGDAQKFFDSFRPVGMEQIDKTLQPQKPSNQAPPRILLGMSSDVISLSFNRDGRALTAISQNGEHRVWEVPPKGPAISRMFPQQPVRFLACAFSGDGQTAAACSLGGKLYSLDETAFRPNVELLERLDQKMAWTVALSSDGKTVASGHKDLVFFWPTQMPPWEFAIPGPVNALAFSSDNRMLAAGTTSNTVRVWNLPQRTLLATLEGKPGGVPAAGAVWALAWSPDGKTLAAGGNDQTARLWDLLTRTERALLPHDETIRSLAFSPDGKLLAAGDDAGNVTLWEAGRISKKAFLPGEDGRHAARAVAFSADSKLLAVGSGNQVRLWEVAKVRWESLPEGK